MKQIKSNKKSKKTSKIIWSSIGLIALAGATTLGIASCAASSSKDIVDKGEGNLFASNDNYQYSLEDGIRTALSNPEGIKTLFTAEYDELMYAIVENFKSDNVVLSNQVDNEIETIDEDWEAFLDGLDLEGDDRSIAIQEELDKNGGTLESWKHSKLIEWATGFIGERLFSNDYANIINVNADGTKTVVVAPDRTIITQALENKAKGVTTGYQMGFGAKPNTGDGIFGQEFVDANVALQEKVFQMYIQDEKPFVVNMNLWSYSEDGVGSGSDDIWINLGPTDGGTDEEGNPLPPPEPSGSYITPFFTDVRTENAVLTPVEKFNQFNLANVSNVPGTIESVNNFVPATVNGVDNTVIGLRDEMQKNWTDDSSNFILVEPEAWSLVNEFMLGSMNLFNLDNALTTSLFSANLFESTPGAFVGDTVISEQFDPITRSFMANAAPTGVNAAKINNNDFDKILNKANPDLNPLFTSTNDLWTIDAFHSDATQTSDFIYLRNEFGVHAIALDGWNYIKTGTTFDERITKAGDIFLYRAIQNRENSGDANASEATKSFAIPLSEKLKAYYDANLTKIWTSIFASTDSDALSKTITDNLLGASVGENSFTEAEIDLFTALYNYEDYNSQLSTIDTRTAGLNSTKSSYSVNSGVNTYKNGLASPYVFGQQASGEFNELLMFFNQGQQLNEIDQKRQLYNALIANIDAYIVANADNIKPLVSTESTFKFSQRILASSLSINKVLVNLFTNTEYFSNTITNQVLGNVTVHGETKMSDIITISASAPTTNVAPAVYNLSSYGFNQAQNDAFNFQFINKILGANTAQATIGNDIHTYVDVANPRGAVSINEVQEYKQEVYFKEAYSSKINYENTIEDLYMLTLGVNNLLEDNNADGVYGDRFLERVKSELSINEAAAFAWWNSYSASLTPTTTLGLINTSEKLLAQDVTTASTMFLNQDNNLDSQYLANSNTYQPIQVTNNIFNNVYENTGYGQTNTFTYNNAKNGQMLTGYVGLQKESSTTMPVDVKDYVFPTSQRQTGTNTTSLQGVLYQYGSRASLLEVIETNQNVSDINSLATSIRNKIENPAVTTVVQEVLEQSSRDKKVELLTELINNTTLIPDNAFQAYTGYANGNETTGTIIQGNDNFTSYGAFSQQVNYEDLNYQKVNGNVVMTNGEPTEIETIEQLVNNIGLDLTLDLLLSFANETAIQTTAFNAIGRANQFVVFDENARVALGDVWVSNFEIDGE